MVTHCSHLEVWTISSNVNLNQIAAIAEPLSFGFYYCVNANGQGDRSRTRKIRDTLKYITKHATDEL